MPFLCKHFIELFSGFSLFWMHFTLDHFVKLYAKLSCHCFQHPFCSRMPVWNLKNKQESADLCVSQSSTIENKQIKLRTRISETTRLQDELLHQTLSKDWPMAGLKRAARVGSKLDWGERPC